MDDSVELNENEKTWMELSVTSSVLRKAWEMELARVDLTAPQTMVLYFLHVSREPHTVSALVNRMEAQGLVDRTHDLKRRNWVRVSLTKKGAEAYKRQLNERKVRNITECLSKSELHTLNAMNRKLRARTIDLIREMQPDPYDMLVE
jgi:DNA-binding MarR family transcriptional regulator